jgi:hypothetical protein
MTFKVIKRLGRTSTTLKTFPDQQAAETYIRTQLSQDAGLKIDAIYGIYSSFDDEMPLKEFSQKDLSATELNDATGTAQRGSAQGFRPSPLQTAPRPAGLPVSGFKNEEDKSKK